MNFYFALVANIESRKNETVVVWYSIDYSEFDLRILVHLIIFSEYLLQKCVFTCPCLIKYIRSEQYVIISMRIGSTNYNLNFQDRSSS